MNDCEYRKLTLIQGDRLLYRRGSVEFRSESSLLGHEYQRTGNRYRGGGFIPIADERSKHHWDLNGADVDCNIPYLYDLHHLHSEGV
jgi:hypothetical protein